ncbi:MAG: hypothetical protein V2J25_14920 [Desulfatiglans sp.]|jgi:hypothetical protein|nr:hypothetical protein [Thermodesulfobacteriota bacterium]MEE4354151.1 hypothetical protein [Desulfatiglans sp.]
MGKYPEDPKEIFPEIMTTYKTVFGDDLVSIILYGSGAGKDYRPGKSDINFIVVLSEKGMNSLDKAFEVQKKWRKKRVAIPLFLTEDYVATSTDVFPIEYLNLQRNHLLVYGKDILKDLSFDWECVRLQCEREIKGKLLLLREAFFESMGKRDALKGVIENSMSAILAIFEGLLYLKERDLPAGKREIIQAVSEVLDVDAALFLKLLDVKEEKIKLGSGEISQLYKDYLNEMMRLSKQIDVLGG